MLVRSPFASYSFYKNLDLVKLVIGVTYCQGIGGLDLTNQANCEISGDIGVRIREDRVGDDWL